MEEDTGKNIHDAHGDASLVDFNRSGVPLLEIVSEPDIRTVAEAGAYLRMLRSILMYLEICDGNMEEGSFRCDANISVRPAGQAAFGTKVEVKNMNSFRAVEKAITYEIARQTEALASGERIVQETRLWDADREETRSMRSKEYAHDYRYFPEPDLVPLQIDRRWVEEIRAELPELPRARRQRFVSRYGLSLSTSDILTHHGPLADYFEAAVTEFPDAKAVSNWILSEFLRVLAGGDERVLSMKVPPRNLAGLLRLIADGTISGKIAKDVFSTMVDTGEDAPTIVRREGLTQVADEAVLDGIIDAVMAANPKAIEDFKRGKTAAKKALVGQVMKATGGKANPALVDRLLEDKLSKIQT